MDRLVAHLRGRRFTVLVDALDEAEDPIAIARTVLRRIAQLSAGRVVVGIRTGADDGASGSDLLSDLLAGPGTERVVLARDPDAVAAYTRQWLVDARGTGQLAIDDGEIEFVAQRMAAHPGTDGHFLVARLAVHELIAEPAVLEPRNRNRLEWLLSADPRDLFTSAVRRLTMTSGTAGPLLRALAASHGRGVTRADGMWAELAGAIDPGTVIRETDIDDLLAKAGPYILLDAEYKLTVYRLAHQTFQEVFDSRPDLGA
jgi:hypothetical protein